MDCVSCSQGKACCFFTAETEGQFIHLRLCQFIVMVGESEIEPSSMNIH